MILICSWSSFFCRAHMQWLGIKYRAVARHNQSSHEVAGTAGFENNNRGMSSLYHPANSAQKRLKRNMHTLQLYST